MEGWLIDALEMREVNKDISIKEIEKALNVPYKTVQQGLYRYDHPKEGKEEPKPKYEEQDKGYTIYYGQKQRHKVYITFEDLEEAFNLYCIAHLTLNQVSLKMNLTRREFYAIKTAFDMTKSSMPFTPKQLDYYTADEIAEKCRIKKKQYALTKIEQNKNNDIEHRIKQMDTVDFWHKELCKSVNQIDAKPYSISKVKRNIDELYIAYIADVHAGLEVDNYFNQYNITIMNERMSKLAQSIIDNVPNKTIYLAELGDTVHGIIHGSTQKYSAWVTDATTEVIKAYEQLFLTLISAGFEIDFAKVNGSHESVEKAKQERTEEENFGNIIFDMLQWKYEKFKMIHFIPKLKGLNMCILPIFDYSTLLLHGDNAGISKLKEVDRLFREHNVKEVNAGHKHHRIVEDYNGLNIFFNEPFCGTDQYAGNGLMSSGFGTRLVQYTREGRGTEQLIRY
jgi:hypothetical protein